MIEKENGFVFREPLEVNPNERRQALETALSHPEKPLSDYVGLFHPNCGGLINGCLGKYQCAECKGVFGHGRVADLVK